MSQLWIPVISILFVIVFLSGLFSWARAAHKKMRAAWLELEQEFGFENVTPNQVYPELRGTLNGVEMVVDTVQQEYVRSNGTRGSRPWTRVRAKLTSEPKIQVRSRQLAFSEPVNWPARETGDAVLDQKYEIFIHEAFSLEEALPVSVRCELLTANPPVHILKKVVLWTQLKIVRDPQLLRDALQSCAQLAVAMELLRENEGE